MKRKGGDCSHPIRDLRGCGYHDPNQVNRARHAVNKQPPTCTPYSSIVLLRGPWRFKIRSVTSAKGDTEQKPLRALDMYLVVGADLRHRSKLRDIRYVHPRRCCTWLRPICPNLRRHRPVVVIVHEPLVPLSSGLGDAAIVDMEETSSPRRGAAEVCSERASTCMPTDRSA
jgi:hypothetical protein